MFPDTQQQRHIPVSQAKQKMIRRKQIERFFIKKEEMKKERETKGPEKTWNLEDAEEKHVYEGKKEGNIQPYTYWVLKMEVRSLICHLP